MRGGGKDWSGAAHITLTGNPQILRMRCMRQGRRWRLVLAGALLGALAGVAGLRADDSDGALRGALEQWVATKSQISQERSEWRVARTVMEDRIQLLQREVDLLHTNTVEVRADIGEADEKLRALQGEAAEMQAATAGLQESVGGLEAQVKGVLGQMPAPIQERVRPLSQSIPADPADTKLGLSQRFQNIVGILNEVNKFARELTVASEVRELADGRSAEVSVLYLGLAQAYYCNANGGLGGVGVSGTNGWRWEARDDIAETVAGVLAVQRNERPAQYLRLPVSLGGGAPAGAAAEREQR